MEDIDYSLLGTLSLRETNFLSSASIELIKFLSDNEISTVFEFLYCIDNNSFRVSTHNDTMNEARGLAEILKYKCFNLPMSSSIYLERPILKLTFNLPFGDFTTLGIKCAIKGKTTIYTAINRLGFNDKERNKILSLPEDELLGRTLIDIFQDIVDDKFYKSLTLSEDDKVFYNKVSFYVKYYKEKIEHIIKTELQGELNNLMKELGILLSKKNELDMQIEMLSKNIRIIEEGIRSMGK